MRYFSGEVFRQVDDVDGLEGAAFGAEAATDAKTLGDEADGRLVVYLDADFPALVDRTSLFALLVALLRLAAICVDDGNAQLVFFLVLVRNHSEEK